MAIKIEILNNIGYSLTFEDEKELPQLTGMCG